MRLSDDIPTGCVSTSSYVVDITLPCFAHVMLLTCCVMRCEIVLFIATCSLNTCTSTEYNAMEPAHVTDPEVKVLTLRSDVYTTFSPPLPFDDTHNLGNLMSPGRTLHTRHARKLNLSDTTLVHQVPTIAG